MKRAQGGMTLIGFIIVLAVAGVFIYMGMKVVPMYSEYYAVKQSLEGLAGEPGIANLDVVGRFEAEKALRRGGAID